MNFFNSISDNEESNSDRISKELALQTTIASTSIEMRYSCLPTIKKAISKNNTRLQNVISRGVTRFSLVSVVKITQISNISYTRHHSDDHSDIKSNFHSSLVLMSKR